MKTTAAVNTIEDITAATGDGVTERHEKHLSLGKSIVPFALERTEDIEEKQNVEKVLSQVLSRTVTEDVEMDNQGDAKGQSKVIADTQVAGTHKLANVWFGVRLGTKAD